MKYGPNTLEVEKLLARLRGINPQELHRLGGAAHWRPDLHGDVWADWKSVAQQKLQRLAPLTPLNEEARNAGEAAAALINEAIGKHHSALTLNELGLVNLKRDAALVSVSAVQARVLKDYLTSLEYALVHTSMEVALGIGSELRPKGGTGGATSSQITRS